MKNLIAVVVIILFSSPSVLGKKIEGNISPIFDISPDEKTFALSISNGQESHIYSYSFENKKLVQLTNEKGSYHSRPMYSPDGNKIVFLTKNLEKQKSQIAVLDLATKHIKKLTSSIDFVTEAIFHPNGKQIIYGAAGFIGSYSPMARKAPHDIDIYSIDLDGTNESKITNYSAYELSSISLNRKGDRIMFEATKKNKLEGIYILTMNDTSKIEKVEAINNPRPQIGASFYGTPYYSNNNSKISFIAPYQVYTLNLNNRECKIAWDNTKDKVMAMAIHARFMDNDKKIILSALEIRNRQYTSNAKLVIVDLDKGKANELVIK